MDAICIQVKHWLFLNSTSFIQMNDGPWYSALCSNINIHQRPAPLSKSRKHQHLLFKWQTAAAEVKHRKRDSHEKVDKPIQISIPQRHKAPSHQSNEKRQLHCSKHTHNGYWLMLPSVRWATHLFFLKQKPPNVTQLPRLTVHFSLMLTHLVHYYL